MKLTKPEIVKAAGIIISKAGINALKVDALALEMGITRNELLHLFKEDDDLLIFILLNLENEIQQLIHSVIEMEHSPEKELQYFFKKLYELFNRKSYYLYVLFSPELDEKNNTIQEILTRIKGIAKTFLFQLLEQGKENGVFSKKVATSYLVKRTLGSFRLLMNDQHLTDKMIRDFRILRAEIE
jgi:AcrR family transcriptional regulator